MKNAKTEKVKNTLTYYLEDGTVAVVPASWPKAKYIIKNASGISFFEENPGDSPNLHEVDRKEFNEFMVNDFRYRVNGDKVEGKYFHGWETCGLYGSDGTVSEVIRTMTAHKRWDELAKLIACVRNPTK